ncbi:MAG: signal peptidase I [Lachnospiraceae bacterium]|nr:signal peptidase I [Lachnospiraceae bacterium]
MKKFFKVLFDVLLWILLIVAFLVTLLVFTSDKNNGVSKLFGYMPMTVKTDSMKPAFKSQDLIIVKEIDDLYKLKEGDVITYYTRINGERALNTHRIVEVNENNSKLSFITKGDNNPTNDTDAVQSVDIVGKWTGKKIGGIGKAMDFLRTKKGFFICILLPMILFFLFELYKFIVALIEFKKPQTPEIDEEEIKRKAIEEYLAKQKAEQGETTVESSNSNNSEEAAEKTEASEETKETDRN